MPKILLPISLIALLAIGLAQSASSALITGGINIGGTLTLNSSSPATATVVTSLTQAFVTGDTGTFTNAPYAVPTNTTVTFTGTMNLTGATPATNFWAVGGYHFEVLSSALFAQGGAAGTSGFIIGSGSGVLTGNGFTPTAFNFTLNCSDPPTTPTPAWSFTMQFTSANANGAPVLKIKNANHAAVVSWSDPTFTLQSAPTLKSTFTNIPGATSPYTNALSGTNRVFRLNQ